MTDRLTITRLRGALAATLYVVATIVAPVVHLIHHDQHHSHGTAQVDVEQLKDARTGRVDLEKLAAALGLEKPDHAEAHRAGRTHPHDRQAPVDPAPTHGEGSFEHFALAFVASAPPPATPVPVELDRTERLCFSTDRVAMRLHLLTDQRGQAPPDHSAAA